MTDQIYLSIIVPVFNSAGFIQKSLDSLDSFVGGLKQKAELIVVDDGSEDSSLEICQQWALKQRACSVSVIACGSNIGKGGAVAKGMLKARGQYRVFLDADLAYEPPQILNIIKALDDDAQVAVANRVHPDSRYTISPAFFHYLYTRHVASRVINWFLRLSIIADCYDSQAGLKGFNASAAEEIFSRQMVKGFSFDIEVLFLAQKLGYKIRDVPINYRYFNEPTTVAFIQDGLGILRDLIGIHSNFKAGRYNLPCMDGKRRLIVHADDYAMTLPISKGILKVVAAGAVKSVSVMTNSEDFEVSMADWASLQSNLDLGLHVTLTWGKPLKAASDIPTLVDGDGWFVSKGELMKRAIKKSLSQQEVYLEIKAQFEKLEARCPNITHIDSHHHVHVFPVIRNAVERVAREKNIKIIRAPYEGNWSGAWPAFFKRFVVSLFSAAYPTYWRARDFLCPDNFAGFSLSASEGMIARWKGILPRLPAGVTEIMVHPGFESDNDDTYNEKREDEVSWLSSPEFMEAVKNNEIELVSSSSMER